MRAFIGIFGIWSGLVLLLAACSGGTPIISEDFQEIDALPETLRTEALPRKYSRLGSKGFQTHLVA